MGTSNCGCICSDNKNKTIDFLNTSQAKYQSSEYNEKIITIYVNELDYRYIKVYFNMIIDILTKKYPNNFIYSFLLEKKTFLYKKVAIKKNDKYIF